MALAPNMESDICNMALILLKQAPSVKDIVTPESHVEQLCAQWYHGKRRSLLESHPWNFAIRRLLITKDSQAPAFGFAEQFTLPQDFIRYLSRHDASGLRVGKTLESYQLEDGKLLLNSDGSNEARIRYMYDHTVVSKWSPLFIDLFATELAIKLSSNFTGGKSWAVSLKQDRDALQQQARAIDGQQRPPIRVENSKWLASRRRAGQGLEAGPVIRFPN